MNAGSLGMTVMSPQELVNNDREWASPIEEGHMKECADATPDANVEHLDTLTQDAEMPDDRNALLLDWRSDDAAPFGPRAVVVSDVVVAEQLSQHKPRMG